MISLIVILAATIARYIIHFFNFKYCRFASFFLQFIGSILTLSKKLYSTRYRFFLQNRQKREWMLICRPEDRCKSQSVNCRRGSWDTKNINRDKRFWVYSRSSVGLIHCDHDRAPGFVQCEQRLKQKLFVTYHSWSPRQQGKPTFPQEDWT